MITSENGVILIKHFESFRNKAYQDQAGVWTIGYGTTRIDGNPISKNAVMAEPEAEQHLRKDLISFENSVTKLTTSVFGLLKDQNKFDGLVSFCYNLGAGALQSSTLLKKLNARLPVLEKNFTDWNKIKINGVLTPSAGLIRRRKAEYTLFSTGKLQFFF